MMTVIKKNKKYQMKSNTKLIVIMIKRFTDTYSEIFQDDENKADRFSDYNAYRERYSDDFH
jgi:hypothetical protein